MPKFSLRLSSIVSKKNLGEREEGMDLHFLKALGFALATLGPGLGIGLIGYGALSGGSRNPDTQQWLFVTAIVLTAFTEGLGIVALAFIFLL